MTPCSYKPQEPRYSDVEQCHTVPNHKGSRKYPPQGPTPREMLHYTNTTATASSATAAADSTTAAAASTTSTSATEAPTPGTTPTSTATPSASSTASAAAPAIPSTTLAPLALAVAAPPTGSRRSPDLLSANEVDSSSRSNKGEKGDRGTPLKERGATVAARSTYSKDTLLNCSEALL
ncbi:unnamed protein product [Closterium sp. NIES-53]